MAAFLDPFIYNEMNDADRKAAKKLIFKKLDKSNVSQVNSSSSARSSSTVTKASEPSALEKLAILCGQKKSSSATREKIMTLDEEISSYIKAAKSVTDFQEFWVTHGTELPRLSNLVRRVNVIPATSVASEALFSVAGFIQRKQRASLSSRTLRYLLVLKNRHVIEKFK